MGSSLGVNAAAWAKKGYPYADAVPGRRFCHGIRMAEGSRRGTAWQERKHVGLMVGEAAPPCLATRSTSPASPEKTRLNRAIISRTHKSVATDKAAGAARREVFQDSVHLSRRVPNEEYPPRRNRLEGDPQCQAFAPRLESLLAWPRW